jgi:hypothetical protein
MTLKKDLVKSVSRNLAAYVMGVFRLAKGLCYDLNYGNDSTLLMGGEAGKIKRILFGSLRIICCSQNVEVE